MKLKQHLQVFDGRLGPLEFTDPDFLSADPAHDLLCFFRIVPEFWVLRQFFVLEDVNTLLLDGEVSHERIDAHPGGLDLIGS